MMQEQNIAQTKKEEKGEIVKSSCEIDGIQAMDRNGRQPAAEVVPT